MIVHRIIQFRSCLSFTNEHIYHHLKLEIALAISALNEWEIEINNSAAQGLTRYSPIQTSRLQISSGTTQTRSANTKTNSCLIWWPLSQRERDTCKLTSMLGLVVSYQQRKQWKQFYIQHNLYISASPPEHCLKRLAQAKIIKKSVILFMM